MKMLIKNARYKQFNDYNCFEYKISEVENKIPDTSSLVSTTVLNRKVREIENRITDHAKYISTYISIITSSKTKYLEGQKKLNILITKDSFFLGRIYFTSNDGSQNTFV